MASAPSPRAAVKFSSRSGRRIRQLTDEAARLFIHQGYEETSVQDVAEAAGMLKGSLYYYMDTKEDLLFWVLRRNHEDLRRHVLEEQQYRDLAPLDRVHTFVARHVEFVLDHAAISALYARKFAMLAATPQREQEILGLRRAYEHALVELVVSAQAQDAAATDVDPVLTARAVLAMCNAAHSWFHPAGRYAKEEIVRHHADLAVRTICVQAAVP